MVEKRPVKADRTLQDYYSAPGFPSRPHLPFSCHPVGDSGAMRDQGSAVEIGFGEETSTGSGFYAANTRVACPGFSVW